MKVLKDGKDYCLEREVLNYVLGGENLKVQYDQHVLFLKKKKNLAIQSIIINHCTV